MSCVKWINVSGSFIVRLSLSSPSQNAMCKSCSRGRRPAFPEHCNEITDLYNALCVCVCVCVCMSQRILLSLCGSVQFRWLTRRAGKAASLTPPNKTYPGRLGFLFTAHGELLSPLVTRGTLKRFILRGSLLTGRDERVTSGRRSDRLCNIRPEV